MKISFRQFINLNNKKHFSNNFKSISSSTRNSHKCLYTPNHHITLKEYLMKKELKVFKQKRAPNCLKRSLIARAVYLDLEQFEKEVWNSIFQALAGMDHGSAWLPVFECWQRHHPPLSIIVWKPLCLRIGPKPDMSENDIIEFWLGAHIGSRQ